MATEIMWVTVVSLSKTMTATMSIILFEGVSFVQEIEVRAD